jgi:hypothetical protein
MGDHKGTPLQRLVGDHEGEDALNLKPERGQVGDCKDEDALYLKSKGLAGKA